MNIKELLAKGICPACWGKNLKVEGDYIKCAVCGIHGNPTMMKFCEHVPCFTTTDGQNTGGKQLYQAGNTLFLLAGTVEGCGRVVTGEFCESCRSFLPHEVDHVVVKSRAKPARSQYRDD